jgi:gliding motility-associated-like protein
VVITDGNGCSVASTVTVTNSGGVIANAGPSATISQGSSTTISASGGTNYSWSNGETTSTVIVSPSTTTSYTVFVSDASGCSALAVVIIYVVEPVPDCSAIESPDAFILPNAFSPNGDGKNEYFHLLSGQLLNTCVKEIYIAVYNRWGEKVFESSDINFSWDGFYKGKPEDTAVFAYYLKAVLTDDKEIKKKGNISLLR